MHIFYLYCSVDISAQILKLKREDENCLTQIYENYL